MKINFVKKKIDNYYAQILMKQFVEIKFKKKKIPWFFVLGGLCPPNSAPRVGGLLHWRLLDWIPLATLAGYWVSLVSDSESGLQ